MLAETITLSRPRLSSAIAESVRSGAIAYQLNRPCSFLLYQAGVGLGDTSLRFLGNAAAGGALTWALVGPPPHPVRLPLVLVAVLAAWAIGFCIDALIGLLAFVAEDVAAFEWIGSKLSMVLGGLFLPLDFFPEWLRSVALSMPFAYALYGPSRCFVASGAAPWIDLFIGQAAWLGVLSAVVWLVYRRCLRRLSINGG
jgi:ABC-2 type transport system permease protein